MNILDETQTKMKAALEHLKDEMRNIRTGRATPGMIENLMVEVYGSEVPLKSISSIAVQEGRQLIITPFDSQHVNSIKKWIEKANLGFTPIAEAKFVRVPVPPMTQELREKMGKLCHKASEEAKISIRNIRREANEIVRKQKAEGLAEDLVKKTEKNIQEFTDKFCKEAEEIAAKKEKEISTI
jgi:ribosome recycling factor